MALGLQYESGGGSFDRTPIIKYDARAGRIFRIDRSNASGSWETSQVEITNGFQAVMDLENIEVGYMSFDGVPDFKMVKLGQPLPPKPSDKHKQGFRVVMKLGKQSGGDVREMAANARVSIAGLDALHTQYEAEKGANAGKLPLVQLGGTTPVVTEGKDANGKKQSSTNYQPNWVIAKWIDRPEELGASAAASAPVQQAQAATPEPATADAGDSEW